MLLFQQAHKSLSRYRVDWKWHWLRGKLLCCVWLYLLYRWLNWHRQVKLPSSKSCSKSLTELSALHSISTYITFLFKQLKEILVPVNTGFAVSTVFSPWEDLGRPSKTSRIYFEEQSYDQLQGLSSPFAFFTGWYQDLWKLTNSGHAFS